MVEKSVEYDRKSIWVDKAIEKHYRFFGTAYIPSKVDHFKLLSEVAAIEARRKERWRQLEMRFW